jgi:iron complex outermembrane receptor protein
MALLNSQFDISANVSADFTARYVGRIANQNVPAYAELDVRFSWRPSEKLELSIAGRNLLDAQHPEFGAALPTRREIERSVNASFTWRF